MAGHPSGGFRPIPAPRHATETVFREYRDCPVEIDRDVGQLPASLGYRDDGVTPSSFENRKGIRVPARWDLYLPGHGTMYLEESIVSFSGKIQRNHVDNRRRILCDVNAGGLVISRGLGLSLLNAPQGELIFSGGPR